MVAAPNDDQVFQSAGDKQIAVVDETQIARTQILFTVIDFQARAKVACGLRRPVPVALGDAWPCYPDLSYYVWRAQPPRFRIDDRDALFHPCVAAADQRLFVLRSRLQIG